MRLAYRAEIRPTPRQRAALLQHAGNARWAYNWEELWHQLVAQMEDAQDLNPDKSYMYVLVRTELECLSADGPPMGIYELDGKPVYQEWDETTHEPLPLPAGAVEVGEREGTVGWVFSALLGLHCSDHLLPGYAVFDDFPWWSKPFAPKAGHEEAASQMVMDWLRTQPGRAVLARQMGKTMGFGVPPVG